MSRLSSAMPAPVPWFRRRARAFAVAALAAAAAGCTTFDRLFPPLDAVPAAVQTLADRCAAVVAPGHKPPTGRTNEAPPALERPAPGVAFVDPVFGNCIVRLTARDAAPPPAGTRHDDARRQAFNADASRLLLVARDGGWHLHDGTTLAWLKPLAGGAGMIEPQWHPTDPDLLYVLSRGGAGLALLELDIRRDRQRVVGDFQARLQQVWPDTVAVSTHHLGAPSADGRYWCLVASDRAGRSLGVFTWDLQTDAVLGLMQANGVQIEHVSMSPGGNRCVVATHAPGVGTRAWSRDFSASVVLHHGAGSAGLARDAAGRDVYVSVDDRTPGGDVFMVDLESGQRTVLLPTVLGGTKTAIRFSGRNLARNGWILVSTWAATPADKPRQWLHGKVFALGLSENPVVRTLAHHRAGGADFPGQPQASVNRDFTRVMFNSNWGMIGGDVDAWLIHLPVDALDD